MRCHMGNLKEKLTAAIIGDVALLPAFSAVFVLLSYAYHLLHPDWMSDSVAMALIAFGILFLFVGMFMGIRSFNGNGFIWQVFCPTWQKVILAVMIGFFATAAAIFIRGSSTDFLRIAVDIIGLSVYSYPFAALVYSTKSPIFSVSKGWIIAFIMLLNPIFMLFLRMMAVAVNQEIDSEACGVTIISMADDSPAMAAGLATGDVMNRFNEADILTIEEMRAFMAKSDGGLISIKTRDAEYGVQPLIAGERFILGIIGETAYCDRRL
jgi:hypothetical protein